MCDFTKENFTLTEALTKLKSNIKFSIGSLKIHIPIFCCLNNNNNNNFSIKERLYHVGFIW